MNFLIVYERKSRELENAVLLKLELERRGYSCNICQYYDARCFRMFGFGEPKVLIVSHLYDTASVARNLSRFGSVSHLVNLQYEQVLSEKWEKLGHHNPKGEAIKGFHACWGTATVNRLISAGVPKNNVKLLGALQLDLLRPEYRQGKSAIRNDLGKRFNLDPCKRWTLFLSSFTYADIAKERLRMNESVSGTSLESFVGLHTASRDKILEWFESILRQDRDNYIIYRPHPDELNIDKVLDLECKYPNFRIINHRSAKVWIGSSDNVYSWYSTTVVESHFLDRPYSILRPFELPDDFDSVLLRRATFVTSYAEFELDYFKCDAERSFPIDESYMAQYYSVSQYNPSFMAYCDFLEGLSGAAESQIFNIKKFDLFIASLKTLTVFFIYNLYQFCRLFGFDLEKRRKKSRNNFLVRWFIEMENQIAQLDEEKEIETILNAIVFDKMASAGATEKDILSEM